MMSKQGKIPRKIRMGIIGVGHMGQYHVTVINTLFNRFTVTGIHDINSEKGQSISEKFENPFYERLDDLLAESEAVIIAVPTSMHYEIAKSALKAGCHILIEKPITETVEQAEELVSMASQRGLIIQVGHVERFNGAVQQISKIINNPLLVECRRMNPFTPRVKDVGVILDLMIHDLDIVVNILDQPISSISATGLSIFSPNQEDVANVQLQFASGCIANFTASRATQDRIRTLSITQEKAYICLNYTDQDIEIHRQASTAYLTTREEIRYSQESFIEKLYVHKDNPLKLEQIHFYECIMDMVSPLVPGEKDIENLRLTHQILKQIRTPYLYTVPQRA